MKRFVFPLAVTLCLLAVVSQHTPVSAKDKWISVRTKNFFMVGNANEKDIKEVALKLEQFREVFTRLFPNMVFNTPVPTTVVVFKSHSSFAPFKPGSNVAGYFQPGSDVNYIALTSEVPVYTQRSSNPFDVIFHEYTHLLVNNTFEKAPLWFNEGLAEYYSTFKITDDQKVRLGIPVSSHVLLLRESKMLPFKTLFEVDHKSPHYRESDKKGIFYAQSWALLHYLLIGKTGLVNPLSKFLQLQNADVPMDQAFQQAFGTSFAEMEKELGAYIKKDRYNVLDGHFEAKLELDTNTQVALLTEAEAQAYLGDLLLHSHRKDAYTYLEKALKLDPNLGMAHASLGMAYFREGKVDEAHASLARAVAANSQNYLAHYYYAYTLSRQSPDGQPGSGYTPEVAAKIKTHLQQAIKLRPDYLESYNLLAFVSLVTGEGLNEAIESLKQALKISPGRDDFSFTLAQLYTRIGEYKTAKQMLEHVAKSPKADEYLRVNSEVLLKQLQQIEDRAGTYDQLKPTEDTNGGPPTMIRAGVTTIVKSGPGPSQPQPAPAPTPAPDPSSYLREVLKTPGAGETQVQGKLLRLECDAKGITFVIETEAGLLRLRTVGFEEIELTTYDSNVKGDITCGERKPVNVVVVCYLPNTDTKVKADGILKTIEFVPDDFKLKPSPVTVQSVSNP